MRDRLAALMEEAKIKAHGVLGSMNEGFGYWYADYLLANYVIVPPCEVVYFIVDKGTEYAFVSSKHTDSLKIYELKNLKKYGYYLTKEEAEKALRGEGE